MLKLRTGIKLESLRQPFKKSLQTAAQICADGVEINARAELKPQDLSRTAVRHLKKTLADLNLNVCSLQYPTRRTFYQIDDLDRRLEATKQAMSAAYDLGARVVVGNVETFPPETDEANHDLFNAAISDLALHGQKVGVVFAFSLAQCDGTSARELLQQLPVGIGIAFDPAGLIINNQDPETFMREIADDVVQFRARDAVRDLSLGRGIEVHLGRGSTDLPALLGLLEEKGFDGYFVVERNATEEPVGDCVNAIKYLKSFF